MRKRFKRSIAFLLALMMCLNVTVVSAYTDESTGVIEAQSSWDGVTTARSYTGENFNVTFSLGGYWDGGYNANVKIENTGDSVIENWCLTFALENNLSTIWNAEVVSNDGGQYVVKNSGWNADIPVGGCVEFGISVNENFAGFPNAYKLLGENAQVQEEAYSVEYVLDSDWGSGFTAKVLLTNHTEEPLEDWTLEFDFDREITNIWNGVIESHEGNRYVIKNAGYNANIAAGETISFGFNGTIPDYYEDNMYSFNGKKIMLNKEEKDTDGDDVPDNQEIEVVLKYNADKSKMYVKGKLISLPDKVDSDMDGITDLNDPNPMEYAITDRTLALVEGLSYTNLEAYIGRTVGDARADGLYFENVESKDILYLEDTIIVDANDSASKFIADFWDEGLGSVAVKFVRTNKSTSVIYALRGTEFLEDGNDVTADLDLGIGWDTKQSQKAFKEYKTISSENNSFDYYVVGHSLGGRLAQDVLYKIYNANEGGVLKKKANIKTPVHSATFNALGYNKLVYATLENDVLSKYKGKLINFYYKGDAVGDGLGVSLLFKRAGTQVKLIRRDLAGNKYVEKLMANHGIVCWHNDYSMLYSSHHEFNYWAD